MRHNRSELAIAAKQIRFPDLQRPPEIDRRRHAPDNIADGHRPQKIGFRFDCRCRRALRQVHKSAATAKIVRKRHNRSAVKVCRKGAMVGRHRHFRFDAVFRCMGEGNADHFGEGRVKLVKERGFVFVAHRRRLPRDVYP